MANPSSKPSLPNSAFSMIIILLIWIVTRQTLHTAEKRQKSQVYVSNNLTIIFISILVWVFQKVRQIWNVQKENRVFEFFSKIYEKLIWKVKFYHIQFVDVSFVITLWHISLCPRKKFICHRVWQFYFNYYFLLEN